MLTHVNGKGVEFKGTKGTVSVNRGKFEVVLDGGKTYKFWDKEKDKSTSLQREYILAERELLADAKVKLYNSKDQIQDFLACVKSRQKPICDVGIGASSAICLPPHELRLLVRRQLQVGPHQARVHRRRRHQVAHPRVPRRVEGGVSALGIGTIDHAHCSIFESARGLAHSRTLPRIRKAHPDCAKRRGVRQPSAAFAGDTRANLPGTFLTCHTARPALTLA